MTTLIWLYEGLYKAVDTTLLDLTVRRAVQGGWYDPSWSDCTKGCTRRLIRPFLIWLYEGLYKAIDTTLLDLTVRRAVQGGWYDPSWSDCTKGCTRRFIWPFNQCLYTHMYFSSFLWYVLEKNAKLQRQRCTMLSQLILNKKILSAKPKGSNCLLESSIMHIIYNKLTYNKPVKNTNYWIVANTVIYPCSQTIGYTIMISSVCLIIAEYIFLKYIAW